MMCDREPEEKLLHQPNRLCYGQVASTTQLVGEVRASK
ncbi:Hypothetical protein A7982_11572 [Minicystis rosea]|nr:Hypothetical protein A7982_11572 [Minicystis rosea]